MELNRKWKRRLFSIARGLTEVFTILGVTVLFCMFLQRLGAGLKGMMIGGAAGLVVMMVLVVMLVEVPVRRLLHVASLEEEQLPLRNTSLDPEAYPHSYQFSEHAGISGRQEGQPEHPANEDQPEDRPEPRTSEGPEPGSDYMPGFFGRSLKDFRWKPDSASHDAESGEKTEKQEK